MCRLMWTADKKKISKKTPIVLLKLSRPDFKWVSLTLDFSTEDSFAVLHLTSFDLYKAGDSQNERTSCSIVWYLKSIVQVF